MFQRCVVVLALALCACESNEYGAEGRLKMRWKPPPGVKLEAEATEGALTIARFSGGVEVRSVEAAPPATTTDLDALEKLLVASAKLEEPGEVQSGRAGSIPAGSTVRWEHRAGPQRRLIYYVPGKGRYVLLSLVAPQNSFGTRSDKLELSLASLKLE